MNKIKQIKLKHFKFFYGEVTIDLDRQNTLIFGENGFQVDGGLIRALIDATSTDNQP